MKKLMIATGFAAVLSIFTVFTAKADGWHDRDGWGDRDGWRGREYHQGFYPRYDGFRDRDFRFRHERFERYEHGCGRPWYY